MQMSGDEGISAFPKDDNLFEWLGTIHGSTGTVYEGLEYKISLKFGPRYPNEPPQVQPPPLPARPSSLTPTLQCKFTTRVFHPNVDAQSGSICLDILTAEKWSAVLDVRILQLTTLQRSAASPSAGQGAACLVAVAAFRAQQRIAVEQSSRLTVMI